MQFARISLPVFIILVLASHCAIFAQWTTNSAQNAPVSVGHSWAETEQIITDSAGGAFIVWEDSRSGEGEENIYAQHLDANGIALWQAGGFGVCTMGGAQTLPQVVSDGAGGIIVVWNDLRDTINSVHDLYAQRVSRDGHALWTADGINVSRHGSFAITGAMNPVAASDGAGGVLAAWEANLAVYSARVDANGNILWSKAVTPFSASQPAIARAATGECIIAYMDGSRAAQSDFADIRAQRVGPTGTLMWGDNGAAVCMAGNLQNNPKVVSDGGDGGIVAWEDFRNGQVYQIFGQHLNRDGMRTWVSGSDSNGVALDATNDGQATVSIASTSTGGALVTWDDNRQDVYVQKLSSTGSLEFGSGALRITDLRPTVEESPVLVNDGNDGAFIAWADTRHTGANEDIYAQHINKYGQVLWAANGVAASTATGNQTEPVAATDGSGGVVFAWSDLRNTNDNQNYDIFAQRINGSGSLLDVRRVAAAEPAGYILTPNYPNPFNPLTTFAFTVARTQQATITVFNVLGQAVAQLFNGSAVGGHSYTIQWNATEMPSGVYYYCLTTADDHIVKAMTLTK